MDTPEMKKDQHVKFFSTPTVRFKDLDKLNLVKLGSGGKVLGSSYLKK